MIFLIVFIVKESHKLAISIIPCIAIKMTTSVAMAILTTCTVDLVAVDKKKILMFSIAVWGRIWFLWVPYIGTSARYGSIVPLTIFATLSVIGGSLICVVAHNQNPKPQRQRLGSNAKANKIEMIIKEKNEKNGGSDGGGSGGGGKDTKTKFGISKLKF